MTKEITEYEKSLIETAVRAAVFAMVDEITHESGQKPLYRDEGSWEKWIQGGLSGKICIADRFRVETIINKVRGESCTKS